MQTSDSELPQLRYHHDGKRAERKTPKSQSVCYRPAPTTAAKQFGCTVFPKKTLKPCEPQLSESTVRRSKWAQLPILEQLVAVFNCWRRAGHSTPFGGRPLRTRGRHPGELSLSQVEQLRGKFFFDTDATLLQVSTQPGEFQNPLG